MDVALVTGKTDLHGRRTPRGLNIVEFGIIDMFFARTVTIGAANLKRGRMGRLIQDRGNLIVAFQTSQILLERVSAKSNARHGWRHKPADQETDMDP